MSEPNTEQEVLKRIRELKYKLINTNPIEQRDEYMQLAVELYVLEQRHPKTLLGIIGDKESEDT